MIWDREIDGAGGKPGIISERAYLALDSSIFLLLLAIEYVFLLQFANLLKAHGYVRALGWLLATVDFLLARYLAGVYLRWRGLTRAESTSTTRTPLISDGEPEAEVVAVAPPAWLWWYCAAMFGAVTLICAGLVTISRHSGAGGRFTIGEWLGVLATIGLSLVTVFYGLIVPWLDFRTTVDATGVSGYSCDNAFRRRFIPWSAIAACEVETRYAFDGQPHSIRPILLDAAGHHLIRLDTHEISPADRDRLIRAIQARLPKAI